MDLKVISIISTANVIADVTNGFLKKCISNIGNC